MDPRSGLLTFVGAAVLVIGAAAQSPQGQPPLVKEGRTIKVSDHVYVIPDDNVPIVPNVGIIVGTKATLVVDTGLGPRNAETILREVAKVSRNAEGFLVATHFHPEHAGGNSGFPPSTKFIAARAQQKELDEQGAEMNRLFAGFSPVTADLLKDVRLRRADILFDREYTLDLGGLRVRLMAPGSMHTQGDTMVFVEPDRVLFAGDVVMNRRFLAFGPAASAETWVDVLKQLASLRPVLVVPSHGPTGDASIIDQQRAVLEALRSRVRELKSRGTAQDDASKLLTTEFQAKYPDWTGSNGVTAAVRAMYKEAP
jgi:glyoxylase-like metal-dependent hydrolase (beta-lactamase superfamily II)